MTKAWAISGVDLHLDLRGGRVRAAVEEALREAVSSGRLSPGTRLPSTRSLAGDLGVARNTVAEAYGQLMAEGWLTARSGSGTRVASLPGPAPPAVAGSGPGAESGLDASARVAPRADLRPGSPDVSAFPRAAWLAAARRALAGAPYSALDYGDPRGQIGLRRELAGYLARARGVRTTPEHIVVCAGFAQAIAVLSRALRESGATRMAVERYGLASVRDAVTAAGLDLGLLPVDADGADVGSADGAGAVLLTPAHQFPLGVALSPRRRAAVTAWARATGAWVVEDDYDGEFRFDRHPLGAVQGLAPERVVYAGTASKTLAPGIRLAWLAVPDGMLAEVISAKTLADRQSSSIDQLTLAELIRSGAYDRHIRRARLAYRRRRDRLVREALPGVRVTGIAAGLHALVELPGGRTEAEVVAAAAGRGLALEGLGAYAAAEHDRGQALVVGYAKPPEHAFTGALARLAAVLRDAPARRPRVADHRPRGPFGREAEPFRRELLAHCYRMLGSIQDAEDLVQETYLRAWRSYGGFEGRSSVRTWLYQIATNRCLTELAKPSRRMLPSGGSDPEPDPDAYLEEAGTEVNWLQPAPDAMVIPDSADPVAIVAAREGLRLALIASLQYLPPRQRAVLVLRDVLAFPATEVAVMLGTTTASVKSALQRARARLGELALAEGEITEPTAPQARALLDQYIAAFENADADALERLLLADVTLEATPLSTWFAGRNTCVPFLRDHLLGSPGDWRMLATSANGQPAAAAYTRDQHGNYQPYGICVLTLTSAGIRRISSFGDPRLVTVFGFGPDTAQAKDT